MKIGSIVFSTDQGLGYLAKDFYDNQVVTDVAVLIHGKRPDNLNWYPDSLVVRDLKGQQGCLREFCKSMDAMFFFETPFDWTLIPFCRENGVRTVICPQHECMPTTWPFETDAIINPSTLDQECFPRGVHIPVPAPTDLPWRQRTRARTFVHNAGHGGLNGRNGTKQLLEALWLCECLKGCQSEARFIVRTQEPIPGDYNGPRGDMCGRLTWETCTLREKLYDEGDVFVFPEKFNGLSLPLQEAHASGMLVMTSDRPVNRAWLPIDPLIVVDDYRKSRVSGRCREYDEAIIDPRAIAETIDSWYDRDIMEYSEMGRTWAEENSWERLKPRYLEVLKG